MSIEGEPKKEKRPGIVLKFNSRVEALEAVRAFWAYRDPHTKVPYEKLTVQITNLGDRTEVEQDSNDKNVWKVYIMSNNEYLSDEAMEWLRSNNYL